MYCSIPRSCAGDDSCCGGRDGNGHNVRRVSLAPWDMANVVQDPGAGNPKRSGHERRRTSFGYNTGVGTCVRCHPGAHHGAAEICRCHPSVQQNGGKGHSSGRTANSFPYWRARKVSGRRAQACSSKPIPIMIARRRTRSQHGAAGANSNIGRPMMALPRSPRIGTSISKECNALMTHTACGPRAGACRRRWNITLRLQPCREHCQADASSIGAAAWCRDFASASLQRGVLLAHSLSPSPSCRGWARQPDFFGRAARIVWHGAARPCKHYRRVSSRLALSRSGVIDASARRRVSTMRWD